jgi:hypothetical protein
MCNTEDEERKRVVMDKKHKPGFWTVNNQVTQLIETVKSGVVSVEQAREQLGLSSEDYGQWNDNRVVSEKYAHDNWGLTKPDIIPAPPTRFWECEYCGTVNPIDTLDCRAKACGHSITKKAMEAAWEGPKTPQDKIDEAKAHTPKMQVYGPGAEDVEIVTSGSGEVNFRDGINIRAYVKADGDGTYTPGKPTPTDKATVLIGSNSANTSSWEISDKGMTFRSVFSYLTRQEYV